MHTSGTRAASTCISPSTMISGRRCLTIFVASLTLSTFGWRAEPAVENESMAMRGSIPNRLAVSAVSIAMSASSCELGSIITAQSANRSSLSSQIMKKNPDILWNISLVLMIFRAGRMVSAVENVVPEIIPSASPSCTIMVPKVLMSLVISFRATSSGVLPLRISTYLFIKDSKCSLVFGSITSTFAQLILSPIS